MQTKQREIDSGDGRTGMKHSMPLPSQFFRALIGALGLLALLLTWTLLVNRQVQAVDNPMIPVPLLTSSEELDWRVLGTSLGSLNNIAKIATGGVHTCVLTTSGGVLCWGANSAGQLGNGTTLDQHTPAWVSGLSQGGKAIAAGTFHSCAVTTSDGVLCWGANGDGRLGNGANIDSSLPVGVRGLSSGVKSIATGGYHTCALTLNGGVLCWGANWAGQLGNGSTINQNMPVSVTGLDSGVQAIAASENHTCALTLSGSMLCWGANEAGQLGDGSTTDRYIPVGVTGLDSGVQAIATNGKHTCALTDSEGLLCWGDNWTGQLGDGTTINRKTPVPVSGLNSGVQAITVGYSHTCALTNSGGVLCWGANGTGQLGDGSMAEHRTPVEVSGLNSGIKAVDVGESHSCALATTGGVKCWGYNFYGHLGDGTTLNQHTPVDVLPAPAPGRIICVDASVGGNGLVGMCWDRPYKFLQNALANAISGDEIWVAAGNYYPDEGNGLTDNDPNSAFAISPGIAVYGGFPQGGGTFAERDAALHITVLSGDIDSNDITDASGIVTTTANMVGSNAHHVVTMDGRGATPILGSTRLHGVTITAGGAQYNAAGGGLYCRGSGAGKACSPTLTELTFSGNMAYDGGALYNDGSAGGASSPALTNITFAGNRASRSGGAIYNDGRGGVSSPVLSYVRFQNNSSGNGGAIYSDGIDGKTNPVLTDVLFLKNTAEQASGGAIQTRGDDGASYPVLNRVTFKGNTARLTGGAIWGAYSHPTLTNVVFEENTTMENGGGGGAMFHSNGSATLSNVVFQQNRSAGGGGGLYNFGSSTHITLTNVTFYSNIADVQGGGMLNYGNGGRVAVTSTNVILWDNVHSSTLERGAQVYNFSGVVVTLNHSIVQGGHMGFGGTALGAFLVGANNVNADPLFVDTINGDLRLQSSSPAIDSGDNTTLPESLTTDIAGNPRIVNGTVDIGAYEYQSNGSTSTPTATNTATNTPVPPTSTHTSTNTAIPPTSLSTSTFTPTSTNTQTNTPVPLTDTPVPPTSTQTPTNTPIPLTSTPTPTHTATPTSTPTQTPVIKLLVITDREGLRQEFLDTGYSEGQDEDLNGTDDWDDLWQKVNSYVAQHNGIILDLAVEITQENGYQFNYGGLNYNHHQDRLQMAKAIDELIYQTIAKQHKGVENIVLMGDDQVVPFYRVPDPVETYTATRSKERDYPESVGGSQGNAVLEDSSRGYILSDVPYAVKGRHTVEVRSHLQPDLGVGRIFAPTPDMLRKSILAYEQPLNLQRETAQFAGFTPLFLKDSGIGETNRPKIDFTSALQRSTWPVIEHWFRPGARMLYDGDHQTWDEQTVINALADDSLITVWSHANHREIEVVSQGYSGRINVDALRQIQKKSDGGTILIALGCNLGYSVGNHPDWSPSEHYEHALANELIAKGITFVAPTGYATLQTRLETPNLNELMTALFIRHLLLNERVKTVGDLWQPTFQDYSRYDPYGSNSNPASNVYYRKALYGYTVYGLPTQPILRQQSLNRSQLLQQEVSKEFVPRAATTESQTIVVDVPEFVVEKLSGGTLFSVPHGGTHIAPAFGPALPIVVRSILLPRNASDISVVQLGNGSANITSNPIDLPQTGVVTTNGEQLEGVFQLPPSYPEELFWSSTSEQEDGLWLNLMVIPVQYSASDRRMTVYTQLQFMVTYTLSTSSGPRFEQVIFADTAPQLGSPVAAQMVVVSPESQQLQIWWRAQGGDGLPFVVSQSPIKVTNALSVSLSIDTANWAAGPVDLVIGLSDGQQLLDTINTTIRVQGSRLRLAYDAIQWIAEGTSQLSLRLFVHNQDAEPQSGLRDALSVAVADTTAEYTISETAPGVYDIILATTSWQPGNYEIQIELDSAPANLVRTTIDVVSTYYPLFLPAIQSQ